MAVQALVSLDQDYFVFSVTTLSRKAAMNCLRCWMPYLRQRIVVPAVLRRVDLDLYCFSQRGREYTAARMGLVLGIEKPDSGLAHSDSGITDDTVLRRQ